MSSCVICNKEDATLKCSVCGRAIGISCSGISNGKIYCLDHIPVQPLDTPKTVAKYNLSGLAKAIWAVLFLTMGSGVIFYIMQRYAANFPLMEAESVAVLIQLFQTTGLIMLEGMVVVLVFLVFIYLVLRRIKK